MISYSNPPNRFCGFRLRLFAICKGSELHRRSSPSSSVAIRRPPAEPSAPLSSPRRVLHRASVPIARRSPNHRRPCQAMTLKRFLRVPRFFGEFLLNPFASSRVPRPDLSFPSLNFKFHPPCTENQAFSLLYGRLPSPAKYAATVELPPSSSPPLGSHHCVLRHAPLPFPRTSSEVPHRRPSRRHCRFFPRC